MAKKSNNSKKKITLMAWKGSAESQGQKEAVSVFSWFRYFVMQIYSFPYTSQMIYNRFGRP